MEHDSFQNINKNYHNLTRKQKELVDTLLANPESVCYISLKELSRRTNTSQVTILRMCKRLGFESFVELKKAFRTHMESLMENVLKASNFPMILPASQQGSNLATLIDICHDSHERSEKFYDSIQPENILLAARHILEAKTVLICGQGLSCVLLNFLLRRLNPLIENVLMVPLEDLNTVQSSLLKLRKGDNVIVIDFPRYYMTVRDVVNYAEHTGATVTAITDSKNSPAVTKNSLNFFCDTKTKVFYNSLSQPMEMLNLIASGVVLEMGSDYDELVYRSREVVHFINTKEKTDNFFDGDH
ncbi:MAG: MurR/RpiR family transcriptional regulator [Oscillospiraceae bacterium]|jgi:DNA-binding MurR/RpiR family transcriptional regulator|nr:MurR/RpiR family transcriptional regulator [Oscillospiraceae bacterium]